MLGLPAAWWKLSWRWLTRLEGRASLVRRGLFRNSLRMAVLGLALGVAVLLVTRAMVAGFEHTLAAGVVRAQGSLVYFSKWRSLDEWTQLQAQLPAGSERAQIFWSSQGLVVGAKGGRGILVEGRRPLGAAPAVPSDEVGIELGKPLAEQIGASKGDTVRVLLPGVLKRPLQAKVAAIVDNGMYEVDARFAAIDDIALRAYMQREEPELYAKRPGDAHALRVWLPRHDDATLSLYRDNLATLLHTYGDARPTLRTWRELKGHLFGAVEHERKTLSLILGLLTLVAALNVAASLLVLFLERDREIAMLRALGLSRGQLWRWIGIQGLLVGVIASLAGLLLGRLLGAALQHLPIARLPADIYNISALPLRYTWADQLGVVSFGVLSCVTVALLLGWRLGRQSFLGTLGHRG